MTTGERIKARMTALGVKGVDITRTTGASSGTISNWKNSVNTPQGGYLVGLCKILECSPEWLISGGNHIADVREQYNTSPLKQSLIKGSVPLISWVQAGKPSSQGDPQQPDDDTETVLITKKYSAGTFALRVEG